MTAASAGADREALREIEGHLLYASPVLCPDCSAVSSVRCAFVPSCEVRWGNWDKALGAVRAALALPEPTPVHPSDLTVLLNAIAASPDDAPVAVGAGLLRRLIAEIATGQARGAGLDGPADAVVPPDPVLNALYDVATAAVAAVDAATYKHPMLSREDAVRAGVAGLIDAVGAWRSLAQGCPGQRAVAPERSEAPSDARATNDTEA